MSETLEEAAVAQNDDLVVRTTTERLAETLDQPADVVEPAVRDELVRWRQSARIQTFVPIFAERSARNRLAS